MNSIGDAWLLNRAGNCIEVHAHPSESFEFESIVNLVSEYGSKLAKSNSEVWKSTNSDASKAAILYSYYLNWCRVRLWKDNKLTFRVATKGINWYEAILDFLVSHPQVSTARITVSDADEINLWDGVSYDHCIDPVNKETLSRVFYDSYVTHPLSDYKLTVYPITDEEADYILGKFDLPGVIINDAYIETVVDRYGDTYIDMYVVADISDIQTAEKLGNELADIHTRFRITYRWHGFGFAKYGATFVFHHYFIDGWDSDVRGEKRRTMIITEFGDKFV